MSHEIAKPALQPQNLLSSLTAGVVIGVISVLAYITPMVALIFSGDLEPFLAIGIGITLVSSAIIGTTVALRSSFAGMIALPVPEQMAVLAVIAAAIAKNLPASITAEEKLLTIVAAIALTSLITGAFLLTLGHLKIGALIRFLPYPVIGGFLAGLGCLLSQGAFTVMTAVPLSFASLPSLFQPDLLWRWVPGLVFAIALLIISRRWTHFLVMPVSFAVATGLFYLALALSQTPVAEASAQGWLLGPFPEGNLWQPLSLFSLAQVNWSIVLGQLSSMLSVMLLTALSLLMVSSGLELSTEREIDLNRELKAVGLGCLLSGLAGGTIGSHAVTTVLVHKMGVRSRLVGIVAACFYIVVLLLGLSLLSFFPKPVLGGLLLFIGLDLLVQWVYESWFKLPRADYFIVLLIMGVIATVGFVEGIAVGLVVAIVLFVLHYSQISVTRNTLSGTSYQSRVVRSPNQTRMLRSRKEQIQVLQLQGSIFFGTAHKLLRQIQQRLEQPDLAKLEFVVLDFHLVNSLDSSAVLSFIKLKQLATQHSISLLFTHLPDTLKRQLRQGKVLSDTDPICSVFPNLDRAIEWCEESILEDSHYRRPRPLPLAIQLASIFNNDKNTATFVTYLEPVKFQEGDYIFHQGDQAEALYFIESGQVSALFEQPGQPAQRVQTLGSGTLVGEVDFYRQFPYRTSAIANQPSKLYRLNSSELDRMEREAPEVAAAFSKSVNFVMAEQLAQKQQEVANFLS